MPDDFQDAFKRLQDQVARLRAENRRFREALLAASREREALAQQLRDLGQVPQYEAQKLEKCFEEV